MKICVESCWCGGDVYKFRLTLADGRRFVVVGEDWTRRVAAEARDVLACETGKPRESFRFVHK